MKIRVWVATGKVGSKCETTLEVDPDAWHDLSEEEQEEEMQEAMFQMIEWGWESKS